MELRFKQNSYFNLLQKNNYRLETQVCYIILAMSYQKDYICFPLCTSFLNFVRVCKLRKIFVFELMIFEQ